MPAFSQTEQFQLQFQVHIQFNLSFQQHINTYSQTYEIQKHLNVYNSFFLKE